ncbi:LysR family transcriptional regulator [Streptomyces spectabilis]|uniref:LysR family transcriptional regulator n=1 Tax=Streptomyces spectabilis TaxID=68270 RepID=UPI0033EF8E31
MDLDLRKLRYFVAVADHRHFGRAAERLYIAQPVLSRQIRAFEQELGCALFVRTTRSVELTAAGRRLHEEARGLTTAVEAALRRVRDADRGVRRIVIAFSPGLHVSEAIVAFTARHPDVEVGLVPSRWWEVDAPLRDGRAQVGHLRRPFDTAGLHVVPIGREPKVACVPVTHRLAGREELLSTDLDGETVLDARRRRTSSVEEKFELVAAGHGIALVPLSVARSYPRPDLVHLTVTDAPPVETCLAVPEGGGEGPVADFVEIATTVLRERAAAQDPQRVREHPGAP